MTLSRKSAMQARRRRGAVAVIAIVCVVVASVIMLVMVRRAVAEHKCIEAEARNVQCRWLVQSAVERAAARLAADSKYAGETWKISAQVLTGRDDLAKDAAGAVVKIELTSAADQPLRRQVRVQADWPDDPALRARVSKQFTIELPPPAKGK